MDEIRQNFGSRHSGGNVLNANWNDDKFHVNSNNPDNRNDDWRVRQEVSEKEIPITSGFLN